MKMRSRQAGTIAVLTILCSPFAVAQASSSTQKPYLMAGIGDSILAAFLANTHLVSGKPKVSREQVVARMEGQVQKAFSPKDLLEHQETLSWFSGYENPSHYVFLAHYLERTEPGSSLEVMNQAKFGAETKDALGQADRIVAAATSGKYKSLKYVTVMIGVNDMCAQNPKVPDAEISANMAAIFEKLASIQQDEPIRVLVVGIGRIADLGLEAIRGNHTFGGLSCGTWYDRVISLCREFTTWDSRERYQGLLQVVNQKNALLRAASEQAAAQWPKLSIRFTQLPSESPVLAQILAKDCFHPNREGQAILSEKLWAEQPWFH